MGSIPAPASFRRLRSAVGQGVCTSQTTVQFCQAALRGYSLAGRALPLHGKDQSSILCSSKCVKDLQNDKKREKAFNFLLGRVMKLSENKADPEITKELIKERFGSGQI